MTTNIDAAVVAERAAIAADILYTDAVIASTIRDLDQIHAHRVTLNARSRLMDAMGAGDDVAAAARATLTRAMSNERAAVDAPRPNLVTLVRSANDLDNIAVTAWTRAGKVRP